LRSLGRRAPLQEVSDLLVGHNTEESDWNSLRKFWSWRWA
jgi:hypothetical protein